MNTSLSVIIPAYNESRTIRKILQKVTAIQLKGITIEVLVVNDFSDDETGELVEEFIRNNPGHRVKLLNHTENMGKGAAIHTGIRHAGGEYLVIQDADLEYNPEEFPDLLKPVISGDADVVYGSRFIGANPHRILFFWHSVGNKMLTFISNMFTNLNLTDMETCYKLFRTEIIRKLYLREKRFGFEPEVTAKISRIPGIRIYEVGISYYGRTYREGKKINWRDGFRAIYCIIRYSLISRRLYRNEEG